MKGREGKSGSTQIHTAIVAADYVKYQLSRKQAREREVSANLIPNLDVNMTILVQC